MPVRLVVDPYGFAGKVQVITGNLDRLASLAGPILKSLLTNPQTHGEMRRALVSAFGAAVSYSMALTLRDHIIEVMDFTDEEMTALRNACTENDQVSGAYGVSSAIYKAFGNGPAKQRE